MSIYSALGRGTTVTLLLPRSHPQLDTDLETDAAKDAGGMHGLLIEDDPHLEELLTQMLGELGAQVVNANSAAEGLAKHPSDRRSRRCCPTW